MYVGCCVGCTCIPSREPLGGGQSVIGFSPLPLRYTVPCGAEVDFLRLAGRSRPMFPLALTGVSRPQAWPFNAGPVPSRKDGTGPSFSTRTTWVKLVDDLVSTQAPPTPRARTGPESPPMPAERHVVMKLPAHCCLNLWVCTCKRNWCITATAI